MRRKIKYTVGLVALFILAFCWGYYNQALADTTFRIGVGTQALDRGDRGEHITQDLMINFDNRWYVQAARFGNGTVVPDTWRYSFGYRVNWREGNKVAPFMRLGPAYWAPEDSVLVSDNWTFDMAVGAQLWQFVDIEWQHNSTAGRSERNSGVDLIVLAINLRF